MLVLSRKRGETIVVGGKVTIEVMEIRGNKVRIGVQVDDGVTIHRGEIQAKIDKEMEELFKGTNAVE